MSEKVIVDSKHPAWAGIDDDDWNGATFGRWLTLLKNCHVVLMPKSDCNKDLLERMIKAIARNAKSVEIVVDNELEEDQPANQNAIDTNIKTS